MDKNDEYSDLFKTVLKTEREYLDECVKNSICTKDAFIDHWVTYLARYLGFSKLFYPDSKIESSGILWITNEVMDYIIKQDYKLYNLYDIRNQSILFMEEICESNGERLEEKCENLMKFLESRKDGK